MKIINSVLNHYFLKSLYGLFVLMSVFFINHLVGAQEIIISQTEESASTSTPAIIELLPVSTSTPVTLGESTAVIDSGLEESVVEVSEMIPIESTKTKEEAIIEVIEETLNDVVDFTKQKTIFHLVSSRKFKKEITPNKETQHSCYLENFRVDISRRDRVSNKIFLSKKDNASYEIEVGGLPEGIDVIFSKKEKYSKKIDSSEAFVTVDIINESDSSIETGGDFIVPIVYTRKGLFSSSVFVCQLNIVNI